MYPGFDLDAECRLARAKAAYYRELADYWSGQEERLVASSGSQLDSEFEYPEEFDDQDVVLLPSQYVFEGSPIDVSKPIDASVFGL